MLASITNYIFVLWNSLCNITICHRCVTLYGSRFLCKLQKEWGIAGILWHHTSTLLCVKMDRHLHRCYILINTGSFPFMDFKRSRLTNNQLAPINITSTHPWYRVSVTELKYITMPKPYFSNWYCHLIKSCRL